MTVSAFVERPPEPKHDLLQVFRHYKQKYGDDVGVVVTGMHIEALEKIYALEERIAKLEARRR